MARLTKAQLVALGEENDVDLSEATTNVEREAALEEAGVDLDAGPDVDPERVCPNCGLLHASSIVPESEMVHLEGQGVKLSALPKADAYRVFICDGQFYPVPHEGDEAA